MRDLASHVGRHTSVYIASCLGFQEGH